MKSSTLFIFFYLNHDFTFICKQFLQGEKLLKMFQRGNFFFNHGHRETGAFNST